MSRPSSHFCDLEGDDDDANDQEEYQSSVLDGIAESEKFDDIEKQMSPLSVLFAASVHGSVKIVPIGLKPVPKSKPDRLSIILLDHGLFTVYKRLFFVSLVLNITGIVLAATGHFPYGQNRPALFSIGNIHFYTSCSGWQSPCWDTTGRLSESKP